MSASDPAERRVFVLTPPPPVRGLATSAVAVLVGAVVLVGSSQFAWSPALSWLGLVLMVVGVAVGVAALVSARRLRSEVTVGRAGLVVASVRGRQSVTWASVERVTVLDGHLVLVPKQEDDRDVVIVNPRTASDPAYAVLTDVVRRRMDADRGYRTL